MGGPRTSTVLTDLLVVVILLTAISCLKRTVVFCGLLCRFVAVAEKGEHGVITVYDVHTLKKRKVLTMPEV